MFTEYLLLIIIIIIYCLMSDLDPYWARVFIIKREYKTLFWLIKDI
jgi:hypothetical protein